MYNEAFEQWYKSAKNFTTPYSGFSKTITDIYQRTLQQQMEIMSENFSRFSEQCNCFSHIKKPEDLFDLQKKCLNENASAAIENTQKLMRTITDNIEELTRLYGTYQGCAASKSGNKEKEVIK